MKDSYTVISPINPVPYLIDMVMNWQVYRDMNASMIRERFLHPLALRKVLFLRLGEEGRVAVSVNRLPRKALMSTLTLGVGPYTWGDYDAGVLTGVDVVTSPGIKASRYLPAFRRAFVELEIGNPGERVIWQRFGNDRLCYITLRESTAKPELALVAEAG